MAKTASTTSSKMASIPPGVTLFLRRIGGIPLWVLVIGFAALVILPIVNMILAATSKGWFAPQLLPKVYTLEWFQRTFEIWELQNTLVNTFIIALLVILGSLLLAMPAAYVLARRDFVGKEVVRVMLLIPLLLPTLTYGISAARILYSVGLNDTHIGIALLQMLPITPYVLLMLTGVIASIPLALEEQAQTLGANRFQVFRRVIIPLLRPGIVAAAAWAFAKSISEFALTFLVFGPQTRTLSVVLYSAYEASGSLPSDNAALTVWLFVPAVLMITFAMRYMRAEAMTLKG